MTLTPKARAFLHAVFRKAGLDDAPHSGQPSAGIAVLFERALGAKFGKLKEGGGEAFLNAISDGINSGDFKYVGQGTLKKGMEAMNIYRGQGLTVVIKTSGEWVTLLESGEGLDLAIQMVP